MTHARPASPCENAGHDVIGYVTSFLELQDALALAQTQARTRDIVMHLPRVQLVSNAARELQDAQHDRDRQLRQMKRAGVCATATAVLSFGASFVSVLGTLANDKDGGEAASYAAGAFFGLGSLCVPASCSIRNITPVLLQPSDDRLDAARLELQTAVASFNQGPAGAGSARGLRDGDLLDPEVSIAVQSDA